MDSEIQACIVIFYLHFCSGPYVMLALHSNMRPTAKFCSSDYCSVPRHFIKHWFPDLRRVFGNRCKCKREAGRERESETERGRERERERERAADVIAGIQGLDGIPAFGDQILSCTYYTTSADISRQKPFPFLLSKS